MKIFLSLVLFFLSAPLFAADTYTSYYNLRQPDLDVEDWVTPWGEKYNNNFYLIDTALFNLAASSGTILADVEALKISTGALQVLIDANIAQLLVVSADTDTLKATQDSIILSTGALQVLIDANIAQLLVVSADTDTLKATQDEIILSTGALQVLIDANIAQLLVVSADTDTLKATQDSIILSTGALQVLIDANIAQLLVVSADTDTLKATQDEIILSTGALQVLIDANIAQLLVVSADTDTLKATQDSIILSTGVIQADVDTRVLKAGDTMTGQLTIQGSSLTVGGYASATRYDISGSTVIHNLGNESLFIGIGAGSAITGGSYNTFIGYNAGAEFYGGGSNNTFLGRNAGKQNYGGQNLFLGDSAGYASTVGTANTFVGSGAGADNTGSRNIIIGAAQETPIAATDDYLNIGGLIVGDMATSSVTVLGALNVNERINLPQTNEPTTPTLMFGTAGTGLYSESAGTLNVAIQQYQEWVFSPTTFSPYTGLAYSPKIMAEDGTDTNPVFTFNTDDNTGIGHGGAVDELTFITAGTKRIEIDSSGYVVVTSSLTATGGFYGDLVGNVTGNVTGAASLNVLKAGDTMTGALTVSSTVVVDKLGIVALSTNSYFNVEGNGTEPYYVQVSSENNQVRYRLSSNGKLLHSYAGTGTEISWANSTFTNLDGNYKLAINSKNGSNSHINFTEAGSARWQIYNAGSSDTLIFNGAAPGNVMSFNAAGDVGIGNITPTHSLTVTGDIIASSSITATGGFYGDLTGDVTGNADTATSVPISGVDLSTVTTALGNKEDADVTIVKEADLDTDDFDVTANVVSIDYVNSQMASSGVNGFLSGTAYDYFDSKLDSESDPVYTGDEAFNITSSSTTDWTTAYTDRLKWDGGSTGLTAATGRTSLDVPTRTGGDASGTWSIAINGNAGTATALAADPTDCTLPNVALGINASGTAQCSQPSDVTGNAATATSLAANPTACTAGQYVTDIDANGDLTCGTPSGAGDVSYASTGTFTGANTFEGEVQLSSTTNAVVSSTNSVEAFGGRWFTTAWGTVCSAGTCAGEKLGDGISSIVWANAGQYTVNFKKTYGMVICNVGDYDSLNSQPHMQQPTSCTNCSSLTVITYNAGSALVNTFGNIMCFGVE